jgi:hypothetical protein
MALFDNPNQKQKKNRMCMTTFENPKFILIELLDEKDWINSMYTKYIKYIFSTTIRSHVCDS